MRCDTRNTFATRLQRTVVVHRYTIGLSMHVHVRVSRCIDKSKDNARRVANNKAKRTEINSSSVSLSVTRPAAVSEAFLQACSLAIQR